MSQTNILSRALDRLPFRKRLIYVFSYALEDALKLLPPRPLPAEITIGEADADRLAAAAAISTRPGDAPLFARRKAAGRRCFAAWQGGRAIGYRWISDSGVDERLEQTIPLQLEKTEGYVYDSYIAPDWRRTPVNRALSRAAIDALIAAGCDRALGVILATNTPSLAAISRYGTIAAAVEQRRRPLRWVIERVRPVPQEEADRVGARFSPPTTIRIAPGSLAGRSRPLVLDAP